MPKRALHSFVVGQRLIHVGAVVGDDDPILKGRDALFEDLDAYVERARSTVEQATAAPGEKRSLASTVKKAAEKASGKSSRKGSGKGSVEGSSKDTGKGSDAESTDTTIGDSSDKKPEDDK